MLNQIHEAAAVQVFFQPAFEAHRGLSRGSLNLKRKVVISIPITFKDNKNVIVI